MHDKYLAKPWIPLVVTSAIIFVLSALPLPLWILLAALLCIALLMQLQIFHVRLLAKQFWLSNYLRPESPLRQYLRRTLLLRFIAVALSLPLAIITYITVFSYEIWDCVAVIVAIILARCIHLWLSYPVDENIADHLVELTHIRIFYWLSIVSIVGAIAVVSVVSGLTNEYSSVTSYELAFETIDEIKHPVRIVRHCARTIRYFELQLLRVRDIAGWPYGWIIYFFFLIPNALPAFGLVTLFSGVERFLKSTASRFL